MREKSKSGQGASGMSSVLDSLNLRCQMTSHIQGKWPFFNTSEAQGTQWMGRNHSSH